MSCWQFVSTSGGCSATQWKVDEALTFSLTNSEFEAPQNGQTVYLTALVGEGEFGGYVRLFNGPLSVSDAKAYAEERSRWIRKEAVKVANYGVTV